MSTWKAIGTGFVVLLAIKAIRFMSDNPIWFIGIVVLGIALVIAIAAQSSARKNEEDAFAAKVKTTSRSDFIRRKEIVRELGWVRVAGCSSTEEVEHKLKAEAGKLDANGIIKFHWTPRRESFVAGKGKKGNPYYQTRTVYDGEGVAVQWRERQAPKSSAS